MIRLVKILFLSISITLLNPVQVNCQVPILEAIKIVTKKVIKAIDLGIQKLQNKTIDLQNIQKQIENTLSKLKLEEISQWTEKQKEIYQEYFDELWRVKSLLAYYKQFTGIIDKQKELFAEYKRAYQLIGKDRNFSADELEYIYGVYSGIIEQSIANVDDILKIMKSFSVQMTDAERLELIRNTHDALDDHLTALRSFNRRNHLLSLQRAKSRSDISAIKQLYGLQ